MTEQNIVLNLNKYELFAPLISATLINALKTSELIAIQQGKVFDAAAEVDKIMKLLINMTDIIQKIPMCEEQT